MRKHRILIVDDEPKLVRLLCTNLNTKDYEILTAATGRQAFELAASADPDVIVLDVMLPDVSGFEVCRELRAMSDVPILMLTARARDSDKLEGFKAGADDYITKPFNVNEFLARISVALRRRGGAAPEPPLMSAGPVRLYPASRRVTVAGEPVHLTPTEYSLLQYLMTNQGKVIVHEQLLSTVWGPEYADSVDYLRVYVAHLRRKLGDVGGRLIRTVSGVGYSLDPSPEDGQAYLR